MRKNVLRNIFLVIPCLLCSCKNIKFSYNIYDEIGSSIKSEFLNDNKLYGAYYENGKNNNENDPKVRYYVINNNVIYNQIIDSTKLYINADFNEKQILVVSYVSVYKNKNIYLNEFCLDGEKLEIVYDYESSGLIPSGSACMPYQRWSAIVMDKVEFVEIEFIEQNQKK